MYQNYQEISKRFYTLTPREKQVMELYGAGLRAQEIAMTLGISYQTVKNHSSRLYKKLRVSGRDNLLAILLQHERLRRLKNA